MNPEDVATARICLKCKSEFWSPRCPVCQVDLKEVLMKLGNRLVTHYGFEPPVRTILEFTEWINDTRSPREALKDLGFDWSK